MTKRISLVALALLLLAHLQARAQELDEQYLNIFSLIERGDSLEEAGQPSLALAKYRQAQTALLILQRDNPNWNAKAVAYKLHYVSDKIATPTPAATPGAEAPSATPGSAPGGTADVKLIEPGAEPRKVLRLHPNPGDKQTVNMTMTMEMDIKAGETPVPAVKTPAIKMSLEVMVKEVSAEGNITYDMAISEASVADEGGAASPATQAIKAALEKVKGLSGTGTISSRGFGKGGEFKAPAGADPQVQQITEQMKDSFKNLVLPLPEEAVGAGAKWESTVPIKSQGMTISQTGTYELVSLDGDHLTIKAAIAQHAANQKIQNPAMQGAKVDLTKMTGKGDADLTYDLGQILPLDATMNFHGEIAMAVNVSGQKQTMDMTMNISLRLEGK